MRLALWILGLLGALGSARALYGSRAELQGRSHVHATFYEDGSPRSKAELDEDRLHGPARTWHRGRRLASEGEYARGERQGPWRFWNDDGSLDVLQSGIYEAGVRVASLDDRTSRKS